MGMTVSVRLDGCGAWVDQADPHEVGAKGRPFSPKSAEAEGEGPVSRGLTDNDGEERWGVRSVLTTRASRSLGLGGVGAAGPPSMGTCL